MKKTISILMLGIAVMLASCSQDEDALQTGSGSTTITFTATLDGSMTQRAMKTRAVEDPTDGTVTRAVLEIYQNGLQVGNRITQTVTDESNITFTAELEENKTYTCYFWADGGDDAYDIENLKAIKRKDAGTPSIAYYATTTIQAQSGTENVTLTHAVSKVVLFETGTLATGDQVGVSFTMPAYTFNVEDGSFDTDGSDEDISGNFVIGETNTSGQVGSLYVFAPAAGTDLTTVTLSYTPSDGSEETTEVSNVPLKMNHRTVLKGAFATIDDGLITQIFNATLDKNWDGDNDTYLLRLTTTTEGQITKELIGSALNADGSLVIEGPVSSDDIYVIREWQKENPDQIKFIDLSGTTGLEKIIDTSFYGIRSLTSVILPSSLEKIGVSVFQYTGLTEIEIPNSVTSINHACFYGCFSLVSITLPEGLTTIMYNTFYDCTSLKEITIPAGVAAIGSCALYCIALESLVFESDMPIVSSSNPDPDAVADQLTVSEDMLGPNPPTGFNVFLPKITDQETAQTYKNFFTGAQAVHYGYKDNGGSKTDPENYDYSL